jgi:hypothetical protein
MKRKEEYPEPFATFATSYLHVCELTFSSMVDLKTPLFCFVAFNIGSVRSCHQTTYVFYTAILNTRHYLLV